MDEISTPATKYLDMAGIQYKIFHHSHLPVSLAEAAHERDQVEDQVIRSILFRLQEGQYLLFLTPGSKQIPWKGLRRALSINRITLATEEEVKEQTGYKIGTVSPFGIPPTIRIIADRSIFIFETVSIGIGKSGYALILRSKDIPIALPNLEIVDIMAQFYSSQEKDE